MPLYAKSYIFFCVFVFLTVLLAIVLLYGRIFHFVKSNTQNPSCVQRKPYGHRSLKYMALLKTVTIVVGVFILCWMPLFVLLLMDFVCPVNTCPVLFKAEYFLGVAMFNSLINPVIYTLTSRDIRRAILKLLCSPLSDDQRRPREEDRTHQHQLHEDGREPAGTGDDHLVRELHHVTNQIHLPQTQALRHRLST